MPESIRSLLHDIADDGSQPSRDLASGAYKRARTITRRRFAIGAVSVVTALALGGAGTAGLLGRDDEALPSPADPTTTQEDTETTDESVDDSCGVRVDEWESLDFEFPALGDSGTEQPLEELPYRMNYRVFNDETMDATWHFGEDGTSEALDAEGDYLYHVAPDGNRVMAVNRTDLCSAAYMEIGFDSSVEAIPMFAVEPVHCPVEWSPDSDKVVFTEPFDSEDSRTWVLNVSTGELHALPEEAFCTVSWLPDSEYLWTGQGEVISADGSATEEVPGLAAVLEDQNYLPTGMSADRGEICVQQSEGDARGYRCDLFLDSETGEELDLPVGGEERQVVFLDDGSMLILSHQDGVATQYLVGADGSIVDQRELPGDAGDILELQTYYPW